MLKKWLRLLLTTINISGGTIFLIAAGFAHQLGFDKNKAWGIQRILLALVGLMMIGFSLLIMHFRVVKKSWLKYKEKLTHPRPVFSKKTSNLSKISWTAVGSFTAIILAWGCITNGSYTNWTPYTRYYDRLANAFKQGSFALLEQPSDELLALNNPYDWMTREGIDYIWDASLYEGRYYLYFGPLPAIIALPFKLIQSDIIIEDQYLLMAFYIGYVLSLGALLHVMHKRFFSYAPAWTLAFLVTLGGVCLPVLWLVKAHNVYETSIMGGQFMLVLGLYALQRGIVEKRNVHSWVMLTGFAWGAAIASRMSLLVAVGFMIIFLIVGWNLQKRQLFRRLIWLILPLVIWGMLLGYYNLARFGNVLEFGHRYQLTGPAYFDNIRNIFSLNYLLPNAFNIIVRPPQVDLNSYPFISAPFISQDMWPWFIRPPANYYYSEPIIGLLPGIPALAFLLTPGINALLRLVHWLNHASFEQVNHNPSLRQTQIILTGGMAGCLLTIGLYVSSTMRYLADIVPLALVLTATLVWAEYEKIYAQKILIWMWLGLFAFLATMSIHISLWINWLA